MPSQKSDKNSKPPQRSENITKITRLKGEDVVPDFPPAGDAEPPVAPKIEYFTPEGTIDPREDMIAPEMISEEKAIAEASTEYVRSDQPLDEQPENKGRSRRVKHLSAAPENTALHQPRKQEAEQRKNQSFES